VTNRQAPAPRQLPVYTCPQLADLIESSLLDDTVDVTDLPTVQFTPARSPATTAREDTTTFVTVHRHA
jgi:hypothetical protein